CAQFFDGRHRLRDIQAELTLAAGGLIADHEPLAELAAKLDAALYLDSPRFRAHVAERAARPEREPACLGCYPAQPAKLRRTLDGSLDAGPGRPGQRRKGPPLRALMVPHIDYARGSTTYAHGFKELAERCDASLFVIVGTAHYSPE